MKTKVNVNIDTVEFSVRGTEFNIPGATTANLINSEGELIDSYQNRQTIFGKHKAHTFQVRTLHSKTELRMEGSPFAYLYGQNVFTSSNLLDGTVAALSSICEIFRFYPPALVRQRWENGDINLERVDLAVNFDLKSESQVNSMLRQIRRQLTEKRGNVKSSGTSVYWMPKKGKEYSIAFYAKGPQMRQSKKIKKIPNFEKVIGECDRILRVEVRLRAAELRKLNLNKVSYWNDTSASSAFAYYMRRLKFLNITSGGIEEKELLNLPSRLRPVLALHKLGEDLTKIFGERSLRRHRRDFRALGIDLRCPNMEEQSVTTVASALSPRRAIRESPAWMKKAGLCP